MRSPREEFREFCPLAPEEITALATPVYVLDTNVLLHLYRYSETARLQFIDLLRLVRKRLFIPYQVALEFHRNRAEVIAEQLAIADKATAALDGEIKNLDATMDSVLTHKYHPYIDRSEVLADLKDALVKARTAITTGSQRYHVDFGTDPILAAVHEVIEGQIGEPFSADELTGIYKEAEDRYAKQVPPGYKDIKKPVPDRYGDLVLWKEALRYGATHKCPTVIVTDDNKEDWILRASGRTISIRPEMRREYYDATNQPVWLYTPERFMQEASRSLGQPVQQDVLNEISERTEDARLRADLHEVAAELAAQASSAGAGPDTAKNTELGVDTVGKIRATGAPPIASETVRRALGLDVWGKVRFDSEAMRRAWGLDVWDKVRFDSEAMRRAMSLDVWDKVRFDPEAMRRVMCLDVLDKIRFDSEATRTALSHGSVAEQVLLGMGPGADAVKPQVEKAKRNPEIPPTDRSAPAEPEPVAESPADPARSAEGEDTGHLRTPDNA